MMTTTDRPWSLGVERSLRTSRDGVTVTYGGKQRCHWKKYFRGHWPLERPPILLTPSRQPEVTAARDHASQKCDFFFVATYTAAASCFCVHARACVCVISSDNWPRGEHSRMRRSSLCVFVSEVCCGGCGPGQRSIDWGASDKISCTRMSGHLSHPFPHYVPLPRDVSCRLESMCW